MKNKILLISVAAVVAISLIVAGCGAPGEPEVVIGMSRPQSGPLFGIAAGAADAIHPPFLALLNAGGGILKSGKYFPVVTDIRDDASTDSLMIKHTGDIINDIANGDIHALWGSCGTHMTFVQAPIANAGQTVLISFEGGATQLKDDPIRLPIYPYVFISLSFSDWHQLPEAAPALYAAHAAYNVSDPCTAYLVCQDDDHGLEYATTANATFGANNITVLGQTDIVHVAGFNYAAVVTTIQGANPDIVCLFCYPDEQLGVLNAAISVSYNTPKAWVCGPGANFGWFGAYNQTSPMVPYAGLGIQAEDVMCFAVANNQTLPWLFDTVLVPPPIPGMTIELEDYWGHPLYWASMEVWEDCMTAAGTYDAVNNLFVIDQDDLKDQLAAYNGTTILGDTWYTLFGSPTPTDGGGIIAWECHMGQFGQWKNGYVEIVVGKNTTDTIDYPKVKWDGSPY